MSKVGTKNVSVIKMLLYIFMALVSVVCLFPLGFMLVASVKSMKDIMSFPMPIFSTGFTFSNFIEIFEKYNFARITLNSFYIALLMMALTIYIATMGGYALSKFNFKIKNFVFILVLGCLMIPFESSMIPLYLIFKKIGLVNNHLGLILPHVAQLAFGIFYMRQFIGGISTELMESGRIDGCTEIGIFHKIILPILKPAFATLGIVFFMESWNSYLWPLILVNSPSKMTIPIALQNFQQAGISTLPPYHLLMAGAVVSVLPMMIAFFSLQKYFIAGITDGSVKG